MTRSSFKYLLVLGVSALPLLVSGTANAQWTTAGPGPQGGTILEGSGNTGPLSDTKTINGGGRISF